jgi:hypothetical protein
MSFIVEVLRQDQVPVPARSSSAVKCAGCGTGCWLTDGTRDYLDHLTVADDPEILCTGCNARRAKPESGAASGGTEEERHARARHLALEALVAAMGEDWPVASAAMRALGAETGTEGLATALLAWCDTLIAAQRRAMGLPDEPQDGEAARPAWLNGATGRVALNADDAPPAARWAGQLVAARAALDREAFAVLLAAMPKDPKARGEYAGALLQGCAMTARATLDGAS